MQGLWLHKKEIVPQYLHIKIRDANAKKKEKETSQFPNWPLILTKKKIISPLGWNVPMQLLLIESYDQGQNAIDFSTERNRCQNHVNVFRKIPTSMKVKRF